MKHIFKYSGYFSILLGLAILAGNVYGQEKERSRLYLRYEKSTNNDKKLTARLNAGRGKNLEFIAGADIALSMSAGDSTVELATVKTDESGSAVLIIKNGYNFIKDEDGFTNFTAGYRGDEKYRKSGSEITVKDIQMDLSPEMVDSVKTVSVFAYETDKDGNQVPVEGLDILIGVQRLYSMLQVGTVKTDAEGKGSVEFPIDIPGDSTGALNIVARIDDNEYYGTVNTRKSVEWGIPVSYKVKALPRQLWSNEAPLWMIFSVFIIISAAWFHFVLAVIRIIRVKKASAETLT
jgi:hypothetical protein